MPKKNEGTSGRKWKGEVSTSPIAMPRTTSKGKRPDASKAPREPMPTEAPTSRATDEQEKTAGAAAEEAQIQELTEAEAPVKVETPSAVEEIPANIVLPRLPKPVYVSDRVPIRLRRTDDLIEAGLALAGIVLMLLIAIFLQSTTQGVEEDVRAVFSDIVRKVLFLPFSVLEGLFVIVAPVGIIVHLAARRDFAVIINTILTAIGVSLIGWGYLLALPHLPEVVRDALIVSTVPGQLSAVDVVIVVLVSMLTVAGTADSSRAIQYSWWGVWILLLYSLIRGTTTLPGVVLTVLGGRLFGTLARWVAGFSDGRAMPADLVSACLDVNILPARIVRADVSTTSEPLETWLVEESDHKPDYRRGQIHPPLVTEPVKEASEEFEVSPQFSRAADRMYQVWEHDGPNVDLQIIDPATSFTSMVGDVWTNFRLKGMSRWVTPSIKASAERSMLTAATAASAGVRTPMPVGLAEAGTSIAVLWETMPQTVSIITLRQHRMEVTDDILDQAWSQLHRAHLRGTSHRNLGRDAVRVDEAMNVWIVDWSEGEVGATPMTRRIDFAQMLVLQSLATDVDRAVDSAVRQIGVSEVLATGLVLQSAALPTSVREAARRRKILDQLRDKLSKIAPAVQAPEPLKLQRFSVRTVLMFVLGATALVVVFGGLNFNAVAEAVRGSNLWWILAAALFGALTWVGAAIPLVAFSPVKIRLFWATMAQMAASIVTLVAPAGVGPAALNWRFLSKQKVPLPVAVATVTLVQVSQFLTSVVLLVVVVVGTGATVDVQIPTTTIIWVAAAVATIAVAVLSIPALRRYLWKIIQPFWDQAYPQFLWALGHPKELLVAFGGNLLQNLGYIAAFGCALAAFGYNLSPFTLAITYLLSSTLGSVIPTPGGIGPVEAALTAGLQVAGIPTAVALSTAVVFRLVTFYGRIPFGWIALRVMEKRKLL